MKYAVALAALAAAAWVAGPWAAELWSRRQELCGIGGDTGPNFDTRR